MLPNAQRGEHTDDKEQGDFIATLTVAGEALVAIDYTPSEQPPVDAPKNRKTNAPMMERRQTAGQYYTICGESRQHPAEHRAFATTNGRLSISLRFNYT